LIARAIIELETDEPEAAILEVPAGKPETRIKVVSQKAAPWAKGRAEIASRRFSFETQT
jgi:hypothetical protein